MWWAKKSLPTESRMDIEQILKAKLETINEECEVMDDTCMVRVTKRRCSVMMKKKKFYKKVEMGGGFRPHISLKLKDSYLMFMSVPRASVYDFLAIRFTNGI
ncbi:hypothetical protein L1987_48940 [Smallanthus sonchifolius]|uniref:Uncharacterized protein n=1 Tax=Smallanthus sonchifolius TaxID=185202 RepID=A0ACB9FUZ9_9ASTR|nr:hypothetical protein L1987_48940 [Smallanthus sonchifolius]